MRRSSWIVLFAALVLVAGLVFVQLRPLDTQAQAMDVRTATEFLERGRAAFDTRQPSAVLALTTEDARLLGQTQTQMTYTLNQAFSSMGREPVQIAWSRVTAKDDGKTAVVGFDLSVGQRSSATDAVFYQSHVTLQLRREKIPHWMGLYTTEEWRVFQAESDKPLDTGT